MALTFGSLFAGIGGFDLGFERAEMECRWQVEIDPFCQKVLAKHWPDVRRYGDVRECGKHNLETVDVICGGFPCQPHSVAGKRRGAEDDRDLWPEYRRVIAELRPRFVVGENVPGIRTTILDQVLSDLEGLDYTAVTIDIPAVAVDAPHRRHRIFVVAHSTGKRLEGATRQSIQGQINGSASTSRTLAHASQQFSDGGNNNRECRSRQIPELGNCVEKAQPISSWWALEPAVGRVAHGVPQRVDRLRALGNAVVPQVAEWIGRRIVEVEECA